MFETVFNEITWDIHGSAPFSPIECYENLVGPMFDKAYASLLEELKGSGLLENTMVVAMGEFGRTPKVNPAGGRDHWPQAWSVLMAGGGVQGGRVIGATDSIGAYPVDRPVTPAQLIATVYHSLGVNLETELPSPGSRPVPVVDFGTEPVLELF
jgi:arylsulfatase A-like enzyme